MRKRCMEIVICIVMIVFLYEGAIIHQTKKESDDFVFAAEIFAIDYENMEAAERTKLVHIKRALILDEIPSMYIALDEQGNVWQWKAGEMKEDAVQISEMQNVIEIMDTGYGSFYALTGDGEVYAWGRNFLGVLDPESNNIKEKPELVKREDLLNIVKMDIRFGSAYAIDKEGRLYVWGLRRYPLFEQNMTAGFFEENQHLIGDVREIYPGTWRYHFFKREDGSFFSIMSLDHINAKAQTYFIFPVFPGDKPVTDWRNDERVVDIRGAEENGLILLYEMGTRDDIVCLANDDCTMYMYMEDATLWYWNNDRITFYNKQEAGASVELRDYDYSGFFEEVDIRSVLGITDESVETPKIIEISSGRAGVLFLLDDGRVFASEYVTKEVKDIEYYTFEGEVYSQDGTLKNNVCYQMRLKELTFRKLEYENITSIASNGDGAFYLVDKLGNIFSYYVTGDRQ